MDYITSRHSEYRELVRSGVRCGELHSSFTRPNTWHLQCFYDDILSSPESAKKSVESYVRSQWEASLIRFYRKPHGATKEFWCTFVSYAL